MLHCKGLRTCHEKKPYLTSNQNLNLIKSLENEHLLIFRVEGSSGRVRSRTALGRSGKLQIHPKNRKCRNKVNKCSEIRKTTNSTQTRDVGLISKL